MAGTNERLRDALHAAGASTHDIATELEVDPKTVERWITTARTPYSRYRHRIAALLGTSEAYLWPDALSAGQKAAVTESEIVRVYPHRASVPTDVWRHLFDKATERVEILVYSGMWLPDQNPRLAAALAAKADAGAKVRILLGDPDSDDVARRGAEEGIGDALAGKIRNVLVHYGRLTDCENAEVRLHATTLYNSLYRLDDHMLVNAHVYGFPAAHAPVLHLRRLSAGVLFETYTESFEKVWAHARDAWPARAGRS
ncbi:DUF5919 domain-containing protein [Sporichthya polymorpha]|uniref:DUF5919 domain-containing protein n=1 Tax=Sporichthya polymorpha TaxID=35751 RepID=UPI00037A34F0|nr:DUF5919 domain-containing protein [Sporichthya polymorpha]